MNNTGDGSERTTTQTWQANVVIRVRPEPLGNLGASKGLPTADSGQLSAEGLRGEDTCQRNQLMLPRDAMLMKPLPLPRAQQLNTG